MIHFTLRRISETLDGTLGVLMGFYTLEETAGDDHPRIPPGEYVCERSRYYRGGYATYEVTGVPGRSRILFHKGNTEEDTDGCILLGMELGTLEVRDEHTGRRRRKAAVLRSGEAFGEFMAVLDGIEEWTLVVQDTDDSWARIAPDVEMEGPGPGEYLNAA